MKTHKNKIVLVTIVVLIISLISFNIYQSQWLKDRQENIIGTWISNDDPNLRLEFKNNGKYFRYYAGYDTEEFTYTIESEITSGGLEITYLKMIVVKSEDFEIGKVLEYDINALGDDRLVLNTSNERTNLMAFTKQ